MNSTQTIQKEWKIKKIADLLDYERPDKYIVESAIYSDKNKTPVLTANKSFILGYTDEDFGIYENVPVIIFDDFTTDSKFVDFPFKIKSSAIKILKAKNKDVNLRFVFEKMKSISFPVGNHKRYYISQYQDLEVATPPINEQNKIAEILSSVDEDIEKVDQEINKTEELKRGLMSELLTKGIGHKKFKKTKLGMIPEEWEIIKLEDFCEIKGGKRLPKGDLLVEYKTEYPYIRIVDFKDAGVDLSNLKYLLKEIQEKIKRYTISKNDLYISIAGTIGLVGFVPDILDGANLTENAAKIVIKKGLNKKFLGYFLNSSLGQSQINDLTVKTSQPKLALNKIESIQIIAPDIVEQNKIVSVLSDVDEKISINKKIKYELAEFKKGLMQDLLNGRVRAAV